MSIPSLKLKVITNLSLLKKLLNQISRPRIEPETHEEQKHKNLSRLETEPMKNKTKNFWIET